MKQKATKVFNKPETTTTWDEVFYDPISLQLYDRAIPKMLRWMEVEPSDTVLDAGCGAGVHSIRAVRYGCRVRAVDVSAAALADARRRVRDEGLENSVDFAQEDITKLSLEDASFDKVFSWGVIIHVPEAEKAIAELVRILKPGGRLALYVTNSSAMDLFVKKVGRAILFRRPREKKSSEIGEGSWYELNGEKLWLWHFDVKRLIAYLELRGVRSLHRSAGELTEFHCHCRGWLRKFFLHLNNLWFKLGLPAWPACTNLLVFEKVEKVEKVEDRAAKS